MRQMIEQLHLSWADPAEGVLSLRFACQSECLSAAVELAADGGEARRFGAERLFEMNGKRHYRCLARVGSAARSLVYRVRLETEGKEWRSDEREARGLGREPGDRVRCIFFSDTGLIGRRDGNADGTEAIFGEILRRKPDFLLGGGDYAYANKDDRFAEVSLAVDEWFRQAEPLLSRFPFFAQYGNHEIVLEERYEDWAPRFDHPAGFDDQKCYSFDIGPAHFAAFFTGRPRPKEHHLEWLEADLQAARAAGAVWLIVFTHEPVFGHGYRHPSSFMVTSTLGALCERLKVDLVLSAHDQNYERSYPLQGVPHATRAAEVGEGPYRQGSWPVFAKVSPAGKRSEIGHRFSPFMCPKHEYIAARNDERHHFAELAIDDVRLAFTALYYEVEDASFGEEDRFEIAVGER